MRKGEKGILVGLVAFAIVAMGVKFFTKPDGTREGDFDLPFYSTAEKDIEKHAGLVLRQYKCRECHTLWGTRDAMQAVPSPPLDGIGSLKTEAWLYEYLSARDPQSMIPSRLKARFRMPSYADMPEDDRRALARYLASLKVKDWYLETAKKTEYEKLTGEDYRP